MKSAHGRKLVIGGVALVPGRVRHALPTMEEIREQVESVMIREGFLADAPFEWIGLILRYGEENANAPEIQPINEKDGDLPVAIEVDMKALRGAKQEEVRRMFLQATLRALSAVGRRYALPFDRLEKAMQDMI